MKKKIIIKPEFRALLFLFLGFILLALFFWHKFVLLDEDNGVPRAVLGAPPCLAKPLEQILAEHYPDGNCPFSVNYACPPVLVKQLQNGRDYGVIISGNRKWSNYLKGEGYLLESRIILGNSLVVIVPRSSDLKVDKPQDILQAKKIAMADYSHAPMGKYVQKYLQNHALWQTIKKKAVCGVSDVAALSMVASGSVDLGIVAYSDAQSSSQVKVVYTLRQKVPKIEFEAISIKGCPPKLQDFFDYLVLPSTLEKFVESGFINLRKGK